MARATTAAVAGMLVFLIAFALWRYCRFWWRASDRPHGLPIPTRVPVPIYVISMPRSQYGVLRPREELTARFLEAGVSSFTFVDAVDGREVSDTSQFSNEVKWKPAQVGCALSHMRLWDALHKAGGAATEGGVVIMEDDAELLPEFVKNLREVMDAVRADTSVDIVFIGHCFETRGRPWKGSPRLRESVLPRCTHAYVVTKRGLAKLATLASTVVLAEPIDEWLAKLCKSGRLACLSSHPQLAKQEWQDASGALLVPAPTVVPAGFEPARA